MCKDQPQVNPDKGHWTSGEHGTRELGLCIRNKIVILRMQLTALVEIQTNKQARLYFVYITSIQARL